MISVVFTQNNEHYKSVAVSGHAFAQEPGFDLVCAAVSSIMTGALNGFDALVASAQLEMSEEPYIKISVENADTTSDLLFKFVYLQLKTLEEAEGEYLRIVEKEDTL